MKEPNPYDTQDVIDEIITDEPECTGDCDNCTEREAC